MNKLFRVKKLIFPKNTLFVNRTIVTFNFIYFTKKKKQIDLKIYTHAQKSIDNKKITFLENVKNVPIKF